MTTKLVLLALSICFTGGAHAETIGQSQSTGPVVNSAPVSTETDGDGHMHAGIDPTKTSIDDYEHDDYLVESNNPTNHRRSHGRNRIEWNTVKAQLRQEENKYVSIRGCINPNMTVENATSCLRHSDFCESHASLNNEKSIPVGALIVYHLNNRHMNTIAIKTREHSYYSGVQLEKPMQPDGNRRLIGVYTPPPCKR